LYPRHVTYKLGLLSSNHAGPAVTFLEQGKTSYTLRPR